MIFDFKGFFNMSFNRPILKLRDWINIDKISSLQLSLEFLINNPEKIKWYYLSSNNKAIELVKKNPDKNNWIYISYNKNYKTIELIMKNKDKINWSRLSANKNVIEILERNPNKIVYSFLSSNPSIFTYDYEAMRKNNLDFEEELIKELMKPSRLMKMIEKYGDEYLDILFG
jgi:hypothetical protein